MDSIQEKVDKDKLNPEPHSVAKSNLEVILDFIDLQSDDERLAAQSSSIDFQDNFIQESGMLSKFKSVSFKPYRLNTIDKIPCIDEDSLSDGLSLIDEGHAYKSTQV
jgi:hypothetical protein